MAGVPTLEVLEIFVGVKVCFWLIVGVPTLEALDTPVADNPCTWPMAGAPTDVVELILFAVNSIGNIPDSIGRNIVFCGTGCHSWYGLSDREATLLSDNA